MYKCNECGKVFDRDEVVEIHDDPSPAGVSLPSGHYTFYECPYCGSGDFDDAVECEVCGDYIVDDGETICEDCISKIRNDIVDLRKWYGISVQQFADIVDDME